MIAIRHVTIWTGAAPQGRSTWLILLLGWVLVIVPLPVRAEEIPWRGDYGQAVKEARDKGVPLFINIGGENCFWCKKLEATTLAEPDIQSMLRDRFIPLKVDGDKTGYLVEALKVKSYPTLVLAAPDGQILGTREGYQEVAVLKELMVKVLAETATPDWMQRDFEAATKAIADADYPRVLSLLRTVVEDGKSRPIQVKARAILAELEKHAAERVALAREQIERGKDSEALATLESLERYYPGTLGAKHSKQLLAQLNARAQEGKRSRQRLAEDLLRQARDDFSNQRYLSCLERCEELTRRFSDLPEAKSAGELATEIKENPDWAKAVSDQLGDRLCDVYLSLADSLLKKGQPQKAIHYLERVTRMFPETRQAEIAQGKLARLRGVPGMK
jgi:thioredoxin-like negative regulator of GroEL